MTDTSHRISHPVVSGLRQLISFDHVFETRFSTNQSDNVFDVPLDILKFSFHHSSTKFPFNRVSNQNWFLGTCRALSCEGQFVAFASTSFGAAKVRAATILIPGFADQEQGNKTRGLQGPQLLF